MDWKPVQRALGVKVDGDDGPATWGALLGAAAGRPGAAVCLLRGRSLARHPELQTRLRIADFLSNVTHETGDFTFLREVMTYSTAQRIRDTWPRRFASVSAAAPYVRQPVKLGNYVYARPEEGNTRPGDGYLFRGGGDIQTTFANGFRRASDDVGIDLYANPDRISDPAVAILTAVGYYTRNRLWALAEQGFHQQCRAKLNTGSPSTPRERINGMDDVDRRRTRILALMGQG